MIKVGDKVKITGDTCYHGFNTGDVVTCVTAGVDGMHKFSDGEFKAWATSKDYTPYEPKGPVITETVKRIVPGVYGKIQVCAVHDKELSIGIDQPMRRWGKADLIAARDVFNQLIDAMPDE